VTFPLTRSGELVATAILTAVQNAPVDLGIQDAFYGDQTILPKTPAVCVAPGNKTRDWSGASLRTENIFETYVFVYFSKIQDVQLNTHGAQTLADAVEDWVMQDIKLGGIVIWTLCTQNEPGQITKQGSLMVGNRLTFQSMSKTPFTG
jgi:hypothetical protein